MRMVLNGIAGGLNPVFPGDHACDFLRPGRVGRISQHVTKLFGCAACRILGPSNYLCNAQAFESGSFVWLIERVRRHQHPAAGRQRLCAGIKGWALPGFLIQGSAGPGNEFEGSTTCVEAGRAPAAGLHIQAIRAGLKAMGPFPYVVGLLKLLMALASSSWTSKTV